MASGQDRNFESIEDFLESLDLEEYLSLMKKHAIGLNELTEISEDDLIKLGIDKMGHRKRILKGVKRTLLTAHPSESSCKNEKERDGTIEELKKEVERLNKKIEEKDNRRSNGVELALRLLSMVRFEYHYEDGRHRAQATLAGANLWSSGPRPIMPNTFHNSPMHASFFK